MSGHENSDKHRVAYLLNIDTDSNSAGAGSSDKLYQCNVCPVSFRRKGDLVKHTNIVHLKQRKYPCQSCGGLFGEKGNLNKHMQRSHFDARKYKCRVPNCPKKFNTSDDLRRHERNVHSRGR